MPYQIFVLGYTVYVLVWYNHGCVLVICSVLIFFFFFMPKPQILCLEQNFTFWPSQLYLFQVENWKVDFLSGQQWATLVFCWDLWGKLDVDLLRIVRCLEWMPWWYLGICFTIICLSPTAAFSLPVARNNGGRHSSDSNHTWLGKKNVVCGHHKSLRRRSVSPPRLPDSLSQSPISHLALQSLVLTALLLKPTSWGTWVFLTVISTLLGARQPPRRCTIVHRKLISPGMRLASSIPNFVLGHSVSETLLYLIPSEKPLCRVSNTILPVRPFCLRGTLIWCCPFYSIVWPYPREHFVPPCVQSCLSGCHYFGS